MTATVAKVAYLGLEAEPSKCRSSSRPGRPAFVIVGLPDQAFGISLDWARAALAAIGEARLPANSR